MSLVNDVASGTKVESYFQDVVDKLGVEAQHAKRVVSNEEDLLNSLDINYSFDSMENGMKFKINFKNEELI